MNIKKQTLVGICTALLAILSQISMPLPIGVPLTFQIFGITLIALLLKEKLAMLTVIIYILLGSIGVPVFANFSSGLHCLVGPSGGYLIGFIFMAFIIGLASRNKKWLLPGCLVGVLIDYLFGITQLMFVIHISLREALISNIFPFAKDIVLIICAIYMANSIQRVVLVQGGKL